MVITKHTPKEEVLRLSEDCRMCGGCCTYGVGFVRPEELEKIAQYLSIGEEELKERYFEKTRMFNKDIYKPKQAAKPFGPCIFLKDKKCSIHEVKPFHCRVGNCNEHGEDLTEWHFVNCIVDFDDPQSIRDWQTRTQTKKTIKGGSPKEILGKELNNKILGYEILTKEDLRKEKEKNQKK